MLECIDTIRNRGSHFQDDYANYTKYLHFNLLVEKLE